jgi:predicted dehydrogenase/threonine dehydrogenase-like Zn-dependent dehydrogenase
MQGFRIGQRVACAGGGYAVHAEYAVVPRNLLTLLPKNVDLESAAFATLGAVAMHGFRLAEPQVGEQVAVIGLGLLGLLTIQIASAAGCSVFGIDLDKRRVALATSLGLKASVRSKAEEAALAFSKNRGFDVVLICADTASNDPVEFAAVLARDRGRVVATGAVGLTIPRKIYYEKELSFVNSRSYGPGRYDRSYEEEGKDYPIGYVRWTEGRNIDAVIELMATEKLNVKPLITHRFPIEKATLAYDVITGRTKEASLGVLLTYPENEEVVEDRGIYLPVSTRRTSAVKLGVLGAGQFANAVLLPAIHKVGNIEFVGIASIVGLHAQHSGRKFGFKYATSSIDKIIDDPEVNTVAILTRHDTHEELSVKALQAGKNVFVEKPLAITPEQLIKIEKILRNEKHAMFTVGFNRRFAPLAQSLYSFFNPHDEPMHIHYRVNAGSIPLGHWTQDPAIGGGRIIGEACHFIDFMIFLNDAAPVTVEAQALPDIGKYREDNVSMTFVFPDGSVGILDYLANGDKSFPKERVEVFCGGKIGILDDFRKLELIANGRRKSIKKAQDKGWKGEWAAFAKAIREGGVPPISYKNLIGVTKATFAAVESIRENQKVVIR